MAARALFGPADPGRRRPPRRCRSGTEPVDRVDRVDRVDPSTASTASTPSRVRFGIRVAFETARASVPRRRGERHGDHRGAAFGVFARALASSRGGGDVQTAGAPRDCLLTWREPAGKRASPYAPPRRRRRASTRRRGRKRGAGQTVKHAGLAHGGREDSEAVRFFSCASSRLASRDGPDDATGTHTCLQARPRATRPPPRDAAARGARIAAAASRSPSPGSVRTSNARRSVEISEPSPRRTRGSPRKGTRRGPGRRTRGGRHRPETPPGPVRLTVVSPRSRGLLPARSGPRTSRRRRRRRRRRRARPADAGGRRGGAPPRGFVPVAPSARRSRRRSRRARDSGPSSRGTTGVAVPAEGRRRRPRLNRLASIHDERFPRAVPGGAGTRPQTIPGDVQLLRSPEPELTRSRPRAPALVVPPREMVGRARRRAAPGGGGPGLETLRGGKRDAARVVRGRVSQGGAGG